MAPPNGPQRRFHWLTGALVVVASMVGTGVFTTTGFLIRDLGSRSAVLATWLVGGVMALLGALAYAELVAALPRNGGEYQLLSRIYHPALGFVSGWISLVVGFSAPMAASALAFGEYVQHLTPGIQPLWLAIGLLVTLAVLHGARLKWGSAVQNLVTLIDVVLILVFVVAGLWAAGDTRLDGTEQRPLGAAIFSPEFAVGLVYVSFAYSGWNAAAYVAGELERPERSVPYALAAGTLLVVLLYLGLNYVFLIGAPATELSGAIDVGYIAARHLWGEGPARATSVLVSVGLFTTVSALMMTGPRVYEAMGRDFPRLARLAQRGGTERGPLVAIGLQTLVALAMIVTSSFDALLTYMGFTLSLFAGLTIAGLFVLRRREPRLLRPYRMWGHPLTTLAVLTLTGWMLAHSLIQRPSATLAGLATLAVGFLLYALVRR